MIAFWNDPRACVEREEQAWEYANSLSSRLDKLAFWMWWFCEWAVLGYDQWNRWDIRVNGECDCSSLVYECLWRAGYLTRPAGSPYDYTLYTGSLDSDLVRAGFIRHAVDGHPRYGWVLLSVQHHTALMISDTKLGQASIDENGRATGGQSGDQTGYETNTKAYYNYPWDWYYEPPADPVPKPQRKSKRPTGDEKGAKGGEVLRLFNPFTDEHHWTMDRNEYDHLCADGWNGEGTAWTAPDGGRKVYRMFNPYSGQHHWTLALHEAQVLWDHMWEFEGVTWYSGDNGVAVWRLYNPYDGQHMYTTSNNEHKELVRAGWDQEKIGFYAVS